MNSMLDSFRSRWMIQRLCRNATCKQQAIMQGTAHVGEGGP